MYREQVEPAWRLDESAVVTMRRCNMTPHDSPETAEFRVRRAVQFMRDYNEEADLLGTMFHFAPDYAPHDLLPNYKEAAKRYGVRLFYVGAEVNTYFSNEPLYYVFLSQKQ